MAPVSLPSDERRTPRWFFEACERTWGPFDLDAAADKWNHQVDRYVTAKQDLLKSRPRARRAWLNPPYSRGQLDRFLGFARESVLERRWGRAVCLVPVDPSARWWQRQLETPAKLGRLTAEWLHGHFPAPFTNAIRRSCPILSTTIVYAPTRLRFDEPGGSAHRSTGAKQPSVVVVFDRADVRTPPPFQPVVRVAKASTLLVCSAP